MAGQIVARILFTILPFLAEALKVSHDILTADIFEEQPIGSQVIDIAQELELSVDKGYVPASPHIASSFKIVVANSVISDYFGISQNSGRVSLKKHLDRDTLCHNERICCPGEDERISNRVAMPDGSLFLRTAEKCQVSFRVVYDIVENTTELEEVRVAFCSVDINILDINDCAPRFLIKDIYPTYGGHYLPQSKSISIIIPENTEPNTCFELPMAFDEDSSRFNVQDYRLEASKKNERTLAETIRDAFAIRLGSCDADFHAIYEATGKSDMTNLRPYLQLRQRLDRETIAKYHLKMVVTDGIGSDGLNAQFDKRVNLLPHTVSLSITVIVEDVNDHAPEVESKVNIKLKEDTPVGTRVTQIIARDKDAGDNAKIRYEIRPLGASKSFRFPFSIDPSSGIISVINPLDADTLPQESQGVMTFLVISSDAGQDVSLSSTTTVNAQIDDINDEIPVIRTVDLASRSDPPRPTVQENLPPGTLVAFVTVTDADSGVNGMVSCHVDNPKFALELISDKNARKKELQLVTKSVLDRELSPVQPVTIICVDHAHPVAFAKTGIQRFLVSIADENDNNPTFPNDIFEISVYENNPSGELLLCLNATDADELVSWNSVPKLSPLVYEMGKSGQDFFRLDSMTGNIYTKESFDREKQALFEFDVFVHDHGKPKRSASARVMVRILDRNDHAPEFEQKVYNVSVLESVPIGEVILKVTAHDKDEGPNAEFTYHLEDLRGSAQKHFRLDSHLGNLTLLTELDREVEPYYTFQIYAVDKGTPRQTSYCRINVQVLDVNDNPPKFVYPTQLNHTIDFTSWDSPGSPLIKLTATDKDTGVNAEKIFLIAEGNEIGIFQLDLQSGDLSLKPGLDPLKVAGRYNLKLEVRDDGSPSLSGFTYITVILHATRSPPTTSTLSPRSVLVDRNPRNPQKGSLKSDRETKDPLLSYANSPNKSPESQHDWEDRDEGNFGSEHTLILIICLSAIATMLVFILFIILAWMRRRSLLIAARGGAQPQVRGCTTPKIGLVRERTKTVIVEGAPRSSTMSSPIIWTDGGIDGSSVTAKMTRTASPVYWQKMTTGLKGMHGGRNDTQQVNNCLYAASLGRKLVYHNSTEGTTPVITCNMSGNTYLSVPATNYGGRNTKHLDDFPMSPGTIISTCFYAVYYFQSICLKNIL
uniref:Protocadherin-1 n=1 Tax=Mesocestoides corti TaxID=53468 RepID=A0A5K3F9P2_MESCO